MAVDTRRKRASLIGRGLPFRITLPLADGSIDQGDRRHLLGLYAGIETAPPVDRQPIAFAIFELAQRGAVFTLSQRTAVITLDR